MQTKNETILIPGLSLDAAMAAYVEKVAAQKQALHAKAAPARRGYAKDMWADVSSGVLPLPPSFPLSNYWSQKKAELLHSLAASGDLCALSDTKIGGTNTYSKVLREYQSACVAYLTAKAEAEAGEAVLFTSKRGKAA